MFGWCIDLDHGLVGLRSYEAQSTRPAEPLEHRLPGEGAPFPQESEEEEVPSAPVLGVGVTKSRYDSRCLMLIYYG